MESATFSTWRAAGSFWADLAGEMPPGWRSSAQRGADLGRRLEHAFDEMFDAGASRALVAGTDVPGLTTAHIDEMKWALKKYAGKRWGDIPGELRTKVIQDMQAKYGEDYAQRIKLYFEQLAEMKKK